MEATFDRGWDGVMGVRGAHHSRRMDRDNRNSIHNPQFHSLERCSLGFEFERFIP